MVGCVPRWFTRPQTVTHPDSNHLIANPQTKLVVSPVPCCTVYCNYDRLSDEVKSRFELLGSTYISRLAMRDAWAFVGQEGLKGRSTIEEVLLVSMYFRQGQFLPSSTKTTILDDVLKQE